jgi:hypothetical protein
MEMHAILDLAHIIASVGAGIGLVVWAVIKFSASRFLAEIGKMEDRQNDFEERLHTVERQYINRETLENALKRVEERINLGFSSSNARLDAVYQFLAQGIRPDK